MRKLNAMLLGQVFAAPGVSEGSADPAKSIAAASAVRKEAMQMAVIANDDEKLGEDMGKLLDASEEVTKGPLFIMVDLVRVFGDKLKSFPVPGSKEGNNPDSYSEQVLNDKKVWVKKSGSFYRDFFDATDEGQAISTVLEQLTIADKTPAEATGEFKGMTQLAIMQAKGRFIKRASIGTATYRKAVQLHLKMVELTEAFGDTMKIDYTRDKDKVTPTNATLPLYIQDKEDGLKAKAFNVNGFLALNVEKAKAKGGDFSAIIASGGRQGGEGQGDTSESDDTFNVTKDTFDPATANYAAYLDDIDNIRDVYAAINAKSKDGAYVNDDLLASIAIIARETSAMIAKPAIAARLKAMKDAEAQAA